MHHPIGSVCHADLIVVLVDVIALVIVLVVVLVFLVGFSRVPLDRVGDYARADCLPATSAQTISSAQTGSSCESSTENLQKQMPLHCPLRILSRPCTLKKVPESCGCASGSLSLEAIGCALSLELAQSGIA
jgi:hypothetical protein